MATSTLRRIEQLAAQISQLTVEQNLAVSRARAAGASWAEIGEALGCSPQAAHKRYRWVRHSEQTREVWHERPRCPSDARRRPQNPQSFTLPPRPPIHNYSYSSDIRLPHSGAARTWTATPPTSSSPSSPAADPDARRGCFAGIHTSARSKLELPTLGTGRAPPELQARGTTRTDGMVSLEARAPCLVYQAQWGASRRHFNA